MQQVLDSVSDGLALLCLPLAPLRRKQRRDGSAPITLGIPRTRPRSLHQPYLPSGARSHQVPPRYHVAAARVQTDAAAVATLPANCRATARTALAAAAATLGSRMNRFNCQRRSEAGDHCQLSLYKRSTLRFQELLLARLDSLESAYCAARGQPAAIPDDEETDDNGDADGNVAGNGDRSGAAGAGAGGS
ncbi:MAG: hypothetical protein M1816_005336 [Peltula sp. TS41687]|nr:MAG: hypothetical protein M1816_005336 [Peltula sp. TS41687]